MHCVHLARYIAFKIFPSLSHLFKINIFRAKYNFCIHDFGGAKITEKKVNFIFLN